MGYAYQNSNYGDYYAGDPFLGGIAKKLVGGIRSVAKVAGNVLPGPVGNFAKLIAGSKAAAPPQIPAQPTPGLRGAVQRIVPGGATGYECTGIPAGYHLAKDGSGKIVRNRSMNPANPKALRRAIRREDAFVKLSKKALSQAGYTVKRRGR